ncbi:MAG: hypothetical protein CXT67_06635 [Methanobacteriota archaeon]|jgi:hypothetical protein|nr:MAG: hypothetical protein CXT67_06635 [Euryarchaeota archaeon]HIG19809.1 hypothetical protein [Candidatus Poseidoniales archaeon]
MPNYPPIPFPPSQILPYKDLLIIIGVDGEITRIDNNTLEQKNGAVKPFPSSIEAATIVDDKMIATWVLPELSLARMASLPLNEEFTNGVDMSLLRLKQNKRGQDVPVAGAEWSHSLDAEPLGITSHEGLICFVNYNRGIYCIDSQSKEIWRVKEIEWLSQTHIPDASIIHAVTTAPHPTIEKQQCIWLWGQGSGWVALEWATGEIIAQGNLEKKGILDQVRTDGKGGWLIGFESGEIIRWDPKNNTEDIIEGGPFCDAVFTKSGWDIIAWREDITWHEQQVTRTARKDLGVCFFNHESNGLLVLKNSGEWVKFSNSN